jgi:dTDP-4-amino-4,6-dideoxygalactose transaminase
VSVKLKYLDAWTAARQRNAARYAQMFAERGLVQHGVLALPCDMLSAICRAATDCRHTYNQFVIRAMRRDDLREYLKANGVTTEVYYPLPMHQQECFSYLNYCDGELPHSERAARETLALPVYAELTDAQSEHVVETTAAFLEGTVKPHSTGKTKPV